MHLSELSPTRCVLNSSGCGVGKTAMIVLNQLMHIESLKKRIAKDKKGKSKPVEAWPMLLCCPRNVIYAHADEIRMMVGDMLTLRIAYGTVDAAPSDLKPFVLTRAQFVQDLDERAEQVHDPDVSGVLAEPGLALTLVYRTPRSCI
jgi:hypothetical protein